MSQVLQFEMFTTGMLPADDLWSLVGDLRRIPEWTDADEVLSEPEPPVEVGSRFVTVEGGRRLEWVVITAAPRLLEVKTDGCAVGRFGVGVRVIPDPVGARLIVAGMLDPSGSRLRARAVDLPALRRRCERWSDLALRAARGVA
jgi:hypothetical protein